MLNVERLRALSAVADHGTIARAAHTLHATPSAISQQLTKLEHETGQRLLQPHGRSVRLTPAGRMLVRHADRILASLAEAENDLDRMKTDILGPLRIGAVGSAIRALLPSVISDLVTRHPRLIPTLVDGEAIDMVPQLLAGELDVALIESWDNRPMAIPGGLALEELAAERVDVALSSDHPLARKQFIDLSDLGGLVWAACPPGTESHEALVQSLRTHGIEPEIRYNVADYSTQLSLVAVNLTAALIPEMAQRSAPSGIVFVPTSPILRRRVKVTWRSATESPPVRAFVSALRRTRG
ncbi:LysR family transcriptional regulator [Rhodococcus sp. SRB_17]|nr:LysR family transcriptional regulator [Rhodococcus sp. SRB_17]